MLKQEQNELVTRTNAGTPMGEVFRRYWLPALLSQELPAPDCPRQRCWNGCLVGRTWKAGASPLALKPVSCAAHHRWK